jgi:hypothetical protein
MIRKSPVNPEQGYVYSDLSFYLWPEIIVENHRDRIMNNI